MYGKVSIIMPNYNCEKFIAETINSVLSETYTNWELLIVDDCSTDKSIDIIKDYCEKDSRIKLFINEKNSGAAATRNRAIKEATGRWIAFLDSDDLWLPEKLEQQLHFMVENNISFSFTEYEVIDELGTTKTVFKPTKDTYTYNDILKTCSIGCLTAVYDTTALGKVYMPESATKREDVACWLSILRDGTPAYCAHIPLARYRVRSRSVSSNKIKMIKYQWRLYRRVENLNIFRSFYYLTNWAIKGLVKYR